MVRVRVLASEHGLIGHVFDHVVGNVFDQHVFAFESENANHPVFVRR
jgi:hypothetical protein